MVNVTKLPKGTIVDGYGYGYGYDVSLGSTPKSTPHTLILGLAPI